MPKIKKRLFLNEDTNALIYFITKMKRSSSLETMKILRNNPSSKKEQKP